MAFNGMISYCLIHVWQFSDIGLYSYARYDDCIFNLCIIAYPSAKAYFPENSILECDDNNHMVGRLGKLVGMCKILQLHFSSLLSTNIKNLKKGIDKWRKAGYNLHCSV